jgi:hypothetical protein
MTGLSVRGVKSVLSRSIRLFGVQVHPLRSGQRSAALLVQEGPREQGRTQEDQEGEEAPGQRDR